VPMPEDRELARKLANKDLGRMLDSARALAGKNFHYAEYSEAAVGSTAALGDGEGILVEMTIGARGSLTRSFAKAAAKAWRETLKRHPKAMFGLNIAGYDDDPRELVDFPEVRRYVRAWAKLAGVSFETLDTTPFATEGDIAFLAACGVFGDKIEVVREPPVKAS
jgi:hypothetical protein